MRPFLRFRPVARLRVRGFEFHPRAAAASSTCRSPPGYLAPSRRIRPEHSLRPTGAPSRAGQFVPGFALDAPLGEEMAQAQVVGQIKQRRLMSQVGPHALVPPTSYGEGVGSETAGDLPPRQARLHLEPLQALREVVGENVGGMCAVEESRPASFTTHRSLSTPGACRLTCHSRRSGQVQAGMPLHGRPCMRPLLRSGGRRREKMRRPPCHVRATAR